MLFRWSTCFAHSYHSISQTTTQLSDWHFISIFILVAFLTLNGCLCVVHFPSVLNDIIERFAAPRQCKGCQIYLSFLFSFVYLVKVLSVPMYIIFFTKNSLTSNWVRRFLDLAFCSCFFFVEHL